MSLAPLHSIRKMTTEEEANNDNDDDDDNNKINNNSNKNDRKSKISGTFAVWWVGRAGSRRA
jgi:hypothetical protein